MESVLHDIVPLSTILTLFLFLPWLIFHYVMKVRDSRRLDEESRVLFEETVHRVEHVQERVHTLERILDAEVPGWRERV
ncbi:envelope stress response membrane protein PspB [Parendozoicomonas haliclonae]|uniref:Phage shock protein B n=1 Tax=Parendozoicomonas haliclonae TaxID=1960125 RepID=A0A1X7AI33_9GAMM|nr:envelope stress response membrane protein PspB [Parendozoicomonas haliclonae]SMA44075.1 Phage shock protein B [Parendozoicomonas haliclonae]